MDCVDVGSVLVVPFGATASASAWWSGLAERSELPEGRLAEPVEALEAGVPPELVELGRWVGRSTARRPPAALGLVLPPGSGTGAEARRVRPLVELEVEATEEGLAAISGGERLGLRQRRYSGRSWRGRSSHGPWRRRPARTGDAQAPRDSRPGHDPRGRAPTAACGSRGGRSSRRRRPHAPTAICVAARSSRPSLSHAARPADDSFSTA
jgi:hypothetical protein